MGLFPTYYILQDQCTTTFLHWASKWYQNSSSDHFLHASPLILPVTFPPLAPQDFQMKQSPESKIYIQICVECGRIHKRNCSRAHQPMQPRTNSWEM